MNGDLIIHLVFLSLLIHRLHHFRSRGQIAHLLNLEVHPPNLSLLSQTFSQNQRDFPVQLRETLFAVLELELLLGSR